MSQFRPYLWVFAGPNGAGKSTLAARYLRQRLPIVNPDVIAANLLVNALGAPDILQAGKIAIHERSALLSARQSFAIETTLSGNSEIRLMREAAIAGYKVNLVFVGVGSAVVSQGRVNHRVRLGLHHVSSEDILRRYPRSMGNLPVAMRLAARTYVIDNTSKHFRLVLIRESGTTRIVAEKLSQWAVQAIPKELR